MYHNISRLGLVTRKTLTKYHEGPGGEDSVGKRVGLEDRACSTGEDGLTGLSERPFRGTSPREFFWCEYSVHSNVKKIIRLRNSIVNKLG